MKKNRLTGHVYDFIVGYNTDTVDDIKDIHNYLMKKKKINMYAYLKVIYKNVCIY